MHRSTAIVLITSQQITAQAKQLLHRAAVKSEISTNNLWKVKHKLYKIKHACSKCKPSHDPTNHGYFQPFTPTFVRSFPSSALSSQLSEDTSATSVASRIGPPFLPERSLRVGLRDLAVERAQVASGFHTHCKFRNIELLYEARWVTAYST